MMKKCDECGTTTVTITRFGDGGMFCGKCLRNGKKLSRARVDSYLEENGLVAVPIASLRTALIHANRLIEDMDVDTSVNFEFAIETLEQAKAES